MNENLGTPQTGTRVRYAVKNETILWGDTYRREKGVACLLAFPKETQTVPRLQVAV